MRPATPGSWINSRSSAHPFTIGVTPIAEFEYLAAGRSKPNEGGVAQSLLRPRSSPLRQSCLGSDWFKELDCVA